MPRSGLAALALLVGCGGPEDLAPIPTDQLEVDLIFEATGEGGAAMIASLTTAGEPYTLEGEDELAAIFDGDIFTMIADRFDDLPVYTAEFFDAPVDTDAFLTFGRSTEAESATRTSMSLPPELDVTVPTAISSAATELAWAPSGLADPVLIEVLGGCVERFEAEVADVGAYTLEAGALVLLGDGPCEALLRISRIRPGELDEKFAGGTVLGRQRRDTSVTIDP